MPHCEEFCKDREPDIVARCHDPAGIRRDFGGMMGEATQQAPPFQYTVVHRLRNFSWSLDETVLSRDRLRASGVTLAAAAKSQP